MYFAASISVIEIASTGVDLSTILGGQTEILGGGQKVVKSDKCMGVSQLLGGHVPGLPPLSLCLCSLGIRKDYE